MSKRAIITIAKNLPAWFGECVLPRMEHYAEKCGAELVVIEPPEWDGLWTLQCTAKYVQQHDRSLVIDADVVISREAPSIFDAYSSGKVYMANDAEPGDVDCYRQHGIITNMQAILGPLGWVSGYGNAGVILCGWNHRSLWEWWTDLPPFYLVDQANINYRLRHLYPRDEIGVLGREWNSFGLNTPFSRVQEPMGYNELWRVPDICKDAWIAHAAGFVGEDRDAAIRRMNELMP
jgi:hypothetical protein